MNTQKKCDYCQKVIIDEDEKKGYISFRGSFCSHAWLNERNRYSHLYLTNQNEASVLFDFCDFDCFRKWLNDRKKKAIEALYNSYLAKLDGDESEDVELEAFGITKDDLKEFKIKKR